MSTPVDGYWSTRFSRSDLGRIPPELVEQFFERLSSGEYDVAVGGLGGIGRAAAGGEAIAFVGIDEPVSDDAMKRIKALPQVRYGKMLRF